MPDSAWSTSYAPNTVDPNSLGCDSEIADLYGEMGLPPSSPGSECFGATAGPSEHTIDGVKYIYENGIPFLHEQYYLPLYGTDERPYSPFGPVPSDYKPEPVESDFNLDEYVNFEGGHKTPVGEVTSGGLGGTASPWEESSVGPNSGKGGWPGLNGWSPTPKGPLRTVDDETQVPDLSRADTYVEGIFPWSSTDILHGTDPFEERAVEGTGDLGQSEKASSKTSKRRMEKARLSFMEERTAVQDETGVHYLKDFGWVLPDRNLRRREPRR